MTEQTSDLSALWCTKCGKRVENNPYHQLGTPVYCQEHTLAEKLDDMLDTLPASNYYQELDVEAWKKGVEPYNMTVTLYDNMRYCVKCHKPSRFISIVTGPNNNNYISHNEFCSEVCAIEWYMDVRQESIKAGYSQQHYEVKML